jgi:hypothetical protein
MLTIAPQSIITDVYQFTQLVATVAARIDDTSPSRDVDAIDFLSRVDAFLLLVALTDADNERAAAMPTAHTTARALYQWQEPATIALAAVVELEALAGQPQLVAALLHRMAVRLRWLLMGVSSNVSNAKERHA